jgi:hypothetical protein
MLPFFNPKHTTVVHAVPPVPREKSLHLRAAVLLDLADSFGRPRSSASNPGVRPETEAFRITPELTSEQPEPNI